MTRPLFFKIAFFIALLTASFLFLQQGGHSGVTFKHADKVGHFFIFFSLTLLFDLSFKQQIIKSIIIMSFYGLIIEVLQSFLPYRSASVGDIIADIAGVVVYLLLVKKHINPLNQTSEE